MNPYCRRFSEKLEKIGTLLPYPLLPFLPLPEINLSKKIRKSAKTTYFVDKIWCKSFKQLSFGFKNLIYLKKCFRSQKVLTPFFTVRVLPPQNCLRFDRSGRSLLPFFPSVPAPAA